MHSGYWYNAPLAKSDMYIRVAKYPLQPSYLHEQTLRQSIH